jgi:hypothetical protein
VIDSSFRRFYTRRISVSQVPYEDETKCAQWLHELFQEKDRLYEHFVQNDTFAGLGVPKISLVPNYSDVFIQFFWFITIGIPSLIWLARFLITSTWYAKLIFALIILIAHFIFERMINMSVIKKDTKRQKKTG